MSNEQPDAGQVFIETMIDLTMHSIMATAVNETFGVDISKPAETVQEREFEQFLEACVPTIRAAVLGAVRSYLEAAGPAAHVWHARALEMRDLLAEHLEGAHNMDLDTYYAMKMVEDNMIPGVSEEPCPEHGLPLDAAAFKGSVTLQSDENTELHLKRFTPAEEYCQDISCYQAVIEAIGNKIIEDHIREEHGEDGHQHG